MKKIVAILLICLVAVAGVIVFFQIRVDDEWKAGLYIPHTEMEVAMSEDTLETDIQVIAVGNAYRKILETGDYTLSVYNSLEEYTVTSTVVYFIESSQYSQCILHLNIKDADVTSITGITISSGNEILLEDEISLRLKKAEKSIQGVRVCAVTAIETENGFENQYHIINQGQYDVKFQGVEWELFDPQATKITYVNGVELDEANIDMQGLRLLEPEGITIEAGKEAVVVLTYEKDNSGKCLWGSPIFFLSGSRVGANDLGILTVNELSAEYVLSLIKEGALRDKT